MFDTKSIMTTNVIAVKKGTPIGKAMEILVDNDITGLPVVDDNMALIGIITEKDVLRLLFDLENDSGIVEDFMTNDVVSFDQNVDIIAICEYLVNANFRRVPIVSEGKLVGIISRRDITKYILEPL